MSFFSLLWTFLIGPLKLLFEVIYRTGYDLVRSPGGTIIILSLAMNLLVLPLYRRADAMQEKARDTEAALRPGVSHIKKTFSGNERMMMLQTFYRQNHYSPAHALKGSVSLLLEIPFFMAAYQFLSGLSLLQGASFGPIADLSAPDGLLKIGTLTLNLLPVLMTLINFISAAIYLKGFPLKTKLQLYGMAVFFLVFLYSSPAGLVFYWTLNNVFSLGKNIVYKIWRRKERAPRKVKKTAQPDRRSFVLAAFFLTLFVGVLIPSACIASSPQEFVDVTYFFHPVWYIVNSGVLAAGTFILWFGVFYWLAGPRGKVRFQRALWVCCGIAVIDYMFFGRKLGILSSTLKYEEGMYFSAGQVIGNYAVLIAAAVILLFVMKKKVSAVRAALLAGCAAVAVMAGINTGGIVSSVKEVRVDEKDLIPHFNLSRTGRNVVVLMLDRALGETLPFLVAEKPELKEIYDGFTYYSNVISYGGHTNMAAPAMMGGYEYTPVEMNRRDTELLVDKHNESLKVMPVTFLNEGYEVTVCDPPYANYSWVPDLSIYDDYPGISAYITKGVFGSPKEKQQTVDLTMRNFFCYAVMKASPVGFEVPLYDNGSYRATDAVSPEQAEQVCEGLSVARGTRKAFMDPYNVLESLDQMTTITEEGSTFLFLCNDTTHEAMMLKEPEYEPAAVIDNTAYDEAHSSRFTLGDRVMKVDTDKKMMHYQTNMAVLLSVGRWLDMLKEEGVYDNTRIIITSDHGYFLYTCPDLYYDGRMDLASFYPLLMVKDFDAHGFTQDDSFMTNADVPVMAFKDLVEDPHNPFTGKPIDSSEKTAHDQFIMTDHSLFDVKKNNGYAFLASPWAAVTDDIWDLSDWEIIDDSLVLKEHEIPR